MTVELKGHCNFCADSHRKVCYEAVKASEFGDRAVICRPCISRLAEEADLKDEKISTTILNQQMEIARLNAELEKYDNLIGACPPDWVIRKKPGRPEPKKKEKVAA